MKLLIEIFSTVFFIGYLPAGGTFATLASLPIVVWLGNQHILFRLLFLSFIIIVAVLVSSVAENIVFNRKDAREIVIDELVGFVVATFMVDITKMQNLAIVFIIYRLLDITKVGINKLQKLPSGFGVVADDIVSGAIANILVRMVIRWL